jgi:predicted 3-demethylubiquinone-9 3-methyltransferase (glyoxalase superfamily)
VKNQIYPCLWFDRQAKAAAEFYCSAFSHSKITSDTAMVVMFELNGKKIMGLNGGPIHKINPSISLFVLCGTINETNEVWSKLIEGGKALMPIDKYDWSPRYGWLQDRFGMTWQIMADADGSRKQTICPSLLFTGDKFGKTESAVKFYTSLFDTSSVEVMMHYPESHANAGKVLFSEFKLNGYTITAMDGPGEHGYTFSEGVSIVVECGTQKEIDFYWSKLTDGGQESMCGWLRDKFGIWWQIVPSVLGKLMTDPERSQRVVQAFMKMKKFDIEALEHA